LMHCLLASLRLIVAVAWFALAAAVTSRRFSWP
jgi:cation transporter-like permease